MELARDHLKSPIHSHKDEYKIAEAMGAGLLKNISLLKHRGIETLKKLRVYGLLGGATDFDLCKMYAVFPNGNDINNFYMVFDSSTKTLRFKLIAENEFIQTFSSAPNDLKESNFSALYGFENPIRGRTLNETTFRELAKLDRGDEIECRRVFAHGFINEHSIQVLERLAELVEIQRQLLEGVDPVNADPNVKYDPEQIKSMTSDRSKHTGVSDSETSSDFFMETLAKDEEEEISDDSDVDLMEDLLNFMDDKQDKENRLENNIPHNCSNELFPRGNDCKKYGYVVMEKALSPYEIQIYKAIRDCPFFPKLFKYKIDEEKGKCALKLERLMILFKEFEYSRFDTSTANIFCLKLLVDLFGAIRTLHKLGFVHGDVTPGNVGYNPRTGTFQLFDFNNSRKITEAKSGSDDKFGGTEYFSSKRYENTGIYDKFDDYVGIMKTCLYCSTQIPGDYDISKDRDFSILIFRFIENDGHPSGRNITLYRHYTELIKKYWQKTGRNSDDPTIKNVINHIKTKQNK